MQESIIKIFPKHLRDVLNACQVNGDCLEEIRLRIRQPLLFFYGNEEWFLDTENAYEKEGTGLCCDKRRFGADVFLS